MKVKPRIVFMGTPEFAVASLGSLLMNGSNIVAVVSAPDRPAGRGLKLTSPAVARYARDNYLDLLQPDAIDDPAFIKRLNELEPEIIAVVAFRKLPRVVWECASIATINLHASLLPDYRGAAPINHAIMNGDQVTGVTTFVINDRIDSGEILMQEKVPIGETDTAGDLHDNLMRAGARLLVSTIEKMSAGELVPVPQETLIKGAGKLRTAPKIFADDCHIPWSSNVRTVYNFIRGLSPHPGARTIIRKGDLSYTLKIIEAGFDEAPHSWAPGTIITDNRKQLRVSASGGYIDIHKLVPEGRRLMNTGEYLRGSSLEGFTISTDPPA